MPTIYTRTRCVVTGAPDGSPDGPSRREPSSHGTPMTSPSAIEPQLMQMVRWAASYSWPMTRQPRPR